MNYPKFFLSLLLLFYSAFTVFSQSHWEAIIQYSDTFKYLEATSEPPANWNEANFDDSEWKSGAGGIGYADGDDSTIIEPVNSLYLRKQFHISDSTQITSLILNMDYDDAFVAYLNGIEVARSSNVIADNPSYNAMLSSDHEATGQFEYFHIQKSKVLNGANTLAVQVINMSLTSSDLSSLIYLNAEINGEEIIYNPIPHWFSIPASLYFESNLPLIHIETTGVEIPDDPRISAKMKVFNNGINTLSDTANEYDGFISIEKRGSSSQYFFPKNSFALETQTDSGTNNNVQLLGLPKENDWILYAPYSDKTMMRNALAYHLANKTGRWSPNTCYCEVIVNNEYQGIYLLTEKIKRDKNRLDIAKLKDNDNAGDSLTGGYILKIDRGEDFWQSVSYNGERVQINYVYPEIDDITPQQKTYIKDHITAFEENLKSTNFNNEENGYQQYINVESFIDFYLLNEFSKNIDAYILSTFLYKDKDSKDHRITMGPFWDYNLAYGNAYYRGGYMPYGWIEDADEPAPFWFEKLLQDPYYKHEMKKRWFALRDNWLNKTHINSFIDSIAHTIDGAKTRNYEKWPIIGEYIWPNDFVGDSFESEINYLKNWISDRFDWMDIEIEKFEDYEPTAIKTTHIQTSVYPNPFSTFLHFSFINAKACNIDLKMYSPTGQLLSHKQKLFAEGKQNWQIELDQLKKYNGMVIYKLTANNTLIKTGHLIKQ